MLRLESVLPYLDIMDTMALQAVHKMAATQGELVLVKNLTSFLFLGRISA
jgi:hypothetical protein